MLELYGIFQMMLNFASITIRMFFLLATVLFFMSSTSSAYDNNSFIGSLGDVPLMKELSIVENSETSLDLPDGRIVEIFATGSLSKDAISKFYQESLPTLGWKHEQGNSYIRDKESLKLDFFDGDNSFTTLRFTISPHRE